MSDNIPKRELRIILIGRTGVGKSAAGNTILGRNAFRSELSASPVTRKCSFEECLIEGNKYTIIDTPGLFYTKIANDFVKREIIKGGGIVSPGLHAIVIVVSFGRFTNEGLDTINYVIELFGEKAWNYMILLFTGKDQLSMCKQSIKDYFISVPFELKKIIHLCGNRCLAFDNNASGEERIKQVQIFANTVENVVSSNGETCYTNESYQDAELYTQHKMLTERQQYDPALIIADKIMSEPAQTSGYKIGLNMLPESSCTLI